MLRGAVIGLVSMISVACLDDSITGSSTVTGTLTEAAINAKTMTIVDPGMTFVFSKE